MKEKTALILIHSIYIGCIVALSFYAIADPFDNFIGFLGAGVIAWFVFLPVLFIITIVFAWFQKFVEQIYYIISAIVRFFGRS